jgi:hypothetical protein
MSGSTNALPLPNPENKSNALNTLVVGPASPYTTIAAACLAAAAMTPTEANPAVIEVRPGDYSESFILPPYTNIYGSNCGAGGNDAAAGAIPSQYGAVFISMPPANNYIIQLPAVESVNAISNLRLSAQPMGKTNGFALINIPADNEGRVTIENCRFLQIQDAAVLTSQITISAIANYSTKSNQVVVESCSISMLAWDNGLPLGPTYTDISAIESYGGIIVVNNCQITITQDATAAAAIGGHLYGIYLRGAVASTASITATTITIDGLDTNVACMGIASDAAIAMAVRFDVLGCQLNITGSDTSTMGIFYGVNAATGGPTLYSCGNQITTVGFAGSNNYGISLQTAGTAVIVGTTFDCTTGASVRDFSEDAGALIHSCVSSISVVATHITTTVAALDLPPQAPAGGATGAGKSVINVRNGLVTLAG